MMQNDAYAPTAEMLAARDVVEAARERAKLLRERVESATERVKTLEVEVPRLGADLAKLDAERLICEDSDVKKLDARIKVVSGELEPKTRELARLKAAIEALEAKAPELDEEVRAAGHALQAERTIWLAGAKAALRDEMLEAVRPVLGVMAKISAIGGDELRDVLRAALVPDPEHFTWYSNGTSPGANLLDTPPDADQAAAAQALSAVHEPLRQSRAAALGHQDYVPLAKRPKPYGPRRGHTYEGVQGDARPFGQVNAKPNSTAVAGQSRAPLAAPDGNAAYAQERARLAANPSEFA
jgi:hypothetical protein